MMRSYVCTGIACILLSSLSIVSSLNWEFTPAGQTACIKVDWDVTRMDLLGSPPSGEGFKHLIDPATGVVGIGSSSCSVSTLSTLSVDFADGVSMSLTFLEANNSMVTMDGTLKFIPFDVFKKPEYENDTVTLSMNGDLKLSANDKSFTCISPLKLMFTSATGNLTYNLDMEATNTQIQAFGISSGNFSEGTACEADAGNSTVTTEAPPTTAAANGSTEAPTTEKPTTEKPTTEKPTTESPTTEAPTTSPPSTTKYYYPNKTDPCIIVAGKFEINVAYTKMDNTTGKVMVTVPAEAVMNGICPQDTKSEISMSWGSSGAMRMVRMAFSSNAESKVEISTISLDVDLDNATFPDSKTAKLKDDVTANLPLSKSTGYYKCKAMMEVTIGESILTMSDVAIQAFNVNGSDFTGEPEECAADNPVTTEPPMTTPAPVTPPPGSPPTNDYTFPGYCIVLNAGLEFVIPYTMNDSKNSSITVGIPANFTTNGSCGNVTQMLEVKFYDDWSMIMTFNGGGSAAQLADSDSFYLEQMTLNYVLQPDIFKNPKNPNAKMVANNTFDSSQFSAKKTGSYECNSKLNFGLNNGVQLNTDNLKVKAFSADNSTGFPSGDLSECPQDSDTNSVVPIAVGAALAGLVIIVLIAYLIGRRRSRSGYQQV